MTVPEQMRACPTPWCSHDCTPYTWQGPSDHYTVICEECQVEGPYCATEAQAITAWNTRPAPAELVEALAFIDKFFEPPWGAWKTAWWEAEVSDAAAFCAENALRHVANMLRRNAGAAS